VHPLLFLWPRCLTFDQHSLLDVDLMCQMETSQLSRVIDFGMEIMLATENQRLNSSDVGTVWHVADCENIAMIVIPDVSVHHDRLRF
jgi:hypothetical protein